MKKNFICFILFAAIATTFASCVKEDMNNNLDDSKVVREFVIDIDNQTKTTFGEGEQSQLRWVAGDEIGFLTAGEAGNLDGNTPVIVSETAVSSVSFPVNEAAMTIYGYYPYHNASVRNPVSEPNSVALYVSPSQIQKNAGELNGPMLPMYAKAEINQEGPTMVKFRPVASLMAFNVFGKTGEKVSYIRFTPAAGAPSGYQTYDLTTEVIAAPAVSRTQAYATVSLNEMYQVPAAKPADKSGYIYLAVVPRVYAGGGTFTVVTDKAKYEFAVSADLDLSDVYSPLTIPVDLSSKEAVSQYLYYENFGKALGHRAELGEGMLPEGYTKSEGVTAVHAALEIAGTTSNNVLTAAASLTTKPFDFLGSEPTDVKVTFYAGGWRGADNKFTITATTDGVATILEENKALGGIPETSAYDDRFAIDKSTEYSFIVKGVKNGTTLTFANGSGDASDRPWIVIDDIAVEEYVAPTGLVVAYSLDMKVEKSGSSSSFNQILVGQLQTNEGVKWTLVNCNPKNKNATYWLLGNTGSSFNQCMLNDTYIKVGAPMGYTTSTHVVSAAISEGKMKNIEKVVVRGGGETEKYPTDISLVYSLNGETYQLVETQTYQGYADGEGENVWTFKPIVEAYYAIVIYKKEARASIEGLQADFYSLAE